MSNGNSWRPHFGHLAISLSPWASVEFLIFWEKWEWFTAPHSLLHNSDRSLPVSLICWHLPCLWRCCHDYRLDFPSWKGSLRSWLDSFFTVKVEWTCEQCLGKLPLDARPAGPPPRFWECFSALEGLFSHPGHILPVSLYDLLVGMGAWTWCNPYTVLTNSGHLLRPCALLCGLEPALTGNTQCCCVV